MFFVLNMADGKWEESPGDATIGISRRRGEGRKERSSKGDRSSGTWAMPRCGKVRWEAKVAVAVVAVVVVVCSTQRVVDVGRWVMNGKYGVVVRQSISKSVSQGRGCFQRVADDHFRLTDDLDQPTLTQGQDLERRQFNK